MNVHMEREPHTDVMHVDVCVPPEGARVDVIEVGDFVGFPGQILARVNLGDRIVYGVTIQRYSSFKRRILWQYRMASIQYALLLFMQTLCAGLRIDHTQAGHHAHLAS